MSKKWLITDVVFCIAIILASIFYFLFLDERVLVKFNETNNGSIQVYSNYDNLNAKVYYKSRLLKGKEITEYEVQDNVNYNVIGEYTIDYIVNYKGHKEKISKKVKVIDNEEPAIEVSDKINVCPNTKLDEYQLQYKVLDNYDHDLEDKVVRNFDKNNIFLEVEDSSHNKTIKSIKVEYNDLVAPDITLIGNEKVSIYLGEKYNEPGYNAFDNCEGDITSKVEVTNNINTNSVGTYEVNYKVSDSYGNVSNTTRTVNVIKKNQYITSTNGGIIYLTFDDGPSRFTGDLLDILKQYNVKATFFVTGQFGYDSYIKRAYNEGHSIGLHTFSHKYNEVYASVNDYFADLNKISDRVYNVTGYRSKLVRLPGGSSNTVSKFNPGIMTRLVGELNKKGYKYFDWNVASNDTGTNNSDIIANNIIKSLGKKGSYIVLQHDIKSDSVKAVKKVIEYSLSNGYEFKALDEDSPNAHHKINN